MSHNNRYSQHDDRAFRKYDGGWENDGDKRRTREYNNNNRSYSSSSNQQQYNSSSAAGSGSSASSSSGRNYYENSSRDSGDDYKRRKYYDNNNRGEGNVPTESSSSHRNEHSDYNNNNRGSYSYNYDSSYHYNNNHHHQHHQHHHRNYSYDNNNNYNNNNNNNNSYEDQEFRERTIYISTLPSNATEQDIKELLEKNNLTNYYEVSMKNQPKGFAYVVFNDITSVTPALALNGSYVKGFPVTIKQAEEKKRNRRDFEHNNNNNNSEKHHSNDNNNYYQGQTKVYAGNVPTIFNRSDLVQLFGAFGYIGKIDMQKENDSGNFNGIALITFQRFEGARKAVSKLNGLSLSSKHPNLKVGFYSENEADKRTDNQDDEEKPNYNNNNHNNSNNQYNSSQKSSSNIYAERFNTLIATDVRGSLTQNISVSHMFEPSVDQLKNVEDCIRKACKSFGNILHIHLDAQNPNGMVYIRFDNTIGSQNAAQRLPSLRGTWSSSTLANSTLPSQVTYESDHQYLSMFNL